MYYILAQSRASSVREMGALETNQREIWLVNKTGVRVMKDLVWASVLFLIVT